VQEGHRPLRPHRRARDRPGAPAPPDRRRAAGQLPLPRHGAREHLGGPARGHLRGHRRRGRRPPAPAEFIERLPQGYDTLLEENAANLSGGQKQRLSIARALLTQPRILILDEAASALDPESEAIFIRNLSRIAVGRTVVMISHRLSTLVNAHAIIVMQQGQAVADIGRHPELLARCEPYQQLWNQQTAHL
jgi:ABC-type multidrug transport system ATPase subunit